MIWKIKISASARKDIAQIRRWYSSESAWAMQNFVKELTAAFDNLTEGVREHRLVHDNYRKLTLKTFPYAVYYQRKEDESTVEINAVLHTHRDNDSVQKHLNQE